MSCVSVPWWAIRPVIVAGGTGPLRVAKGRRRLERAEQGVPDADAGGARERGSGGVCVARGGALTHSPEGRAHRVVAGWPVQPQPATQQQQRRRRRQRLRGAVCVVPTAPLEPGPLEKRNERIGAQRQRASKRNTNKCRKKRGKGVCGCGPARRGVG
jgi:hypothetical protein